MMSKRPFCEQAPSMAFRKPLRVTFFGFGISIASGPGGPDFPAHADDGLLILGSD
jgi:hypothetical protein